MRKTLYFLSTIIFVGAFAFFFNQNQKESFHPKPTTIIVNNEEEGDNQLKREAWFEEMHKAAPGTNWRAMEHQTQRQRHEKRIAAGHFGTNAQSRGDDPEILANGRLKGYWKERGSLNQAGSVVDTEYDPETDQIWLISAGGTLWRGARDGSNWDVINQDFRFSTGLLKFVKTDTGRRLIAGINRVPHYSDDDGITWTAATGVPINDSWGNYRDALVLPDSLNTIYLLSKPSYWADITLYKSIDKGESYQAVQTLNSSNFSNYSMSNPHNSLDVYFVEKMDTLTQVSLVNQQTDELELLNESSDFVFGNEGRANLVGWAGNVVVRLFTYDEDGNVYMTENYGESWEFRGSVGVRPWGVGIFVSPSNPDMMLAGAVNCFRSIDGGLTWYKLNEWWEYYDDVDNKLHADMMHFNEFYTADGTRFNLSSNHGGLNISYDDFFNIDNIGLSGLNVSQYYSVRTNQFSPNWVYAGSQDQGFQRADIYSQDVANFEQVISGDYGHIMMTDHGNDLWTVYPGGWVTYYNFVQTSELTASWQLNVDALHKSVWIPPLMEAPYGQNAVYLAGGNKDDLHGSFMIKLTYDPPSTINAIQGDFDFYEESNEGALSAMEFSYLNQDLFYAATTNGRAYYSQDGGTTWEQSIGLLPSGHYLYGQSIYASKKDTNTVWLAGSGYSNPAVYVSYNGGKIYKSFNEGLPSTLVFEITGNEEETALFAATEAGPYVYIFQEEQWYDMSGLCAPSQTYWSVEYVREDNVVRYGTYGRGIWDFEIDELVGLKPVENHTAKLTIYPNPTNGMVWVDFEHVTGNPQEAQIFDISGRLVQSFKFTDPYSNQLDLSHLQAGTYILKTMVEDAILSKKVIIQ